MAEWEGIHLALTHSTLEGGLDLWACLTREERVDVLAYYEIKRRKAQAQAQAQKEEAFQQRHGGQAGAMAVDAMRSKALIKALRERGTTEEAIQAFLASGQDGGMSRR